MSSLLLGVMGHVDHGKTALVRSLTGVETDRLPEEKRRGVSIVLGFALLETPFGPIDLVDVPGHERFIRAMISGATGMDAVLLVVAANEGVKPQTVEHLEIARLLGIGRGVIALTKCDLVSPDEARDRAEAMRRVWLAAGLEEAPVVATSTVSGQGLGELAETLAGLVREARRRPDAGFFYLPVDRAFVRPGFGAVVTGTLRRGPVALEDRVEIVPGGLAARVRGLQIHGRAVAQAEPGRRVAVSLRGIEVDALKGGSALATPGMLVASRWIDAALEVAPSAPRPLANGERLRLLFGTSDVAVRLRLLDRSEAAPGETALGQLRCAADIAVPAREPFILRLDSPGLTVGGGRVLDPASHRRRRFDDGVLSGLRAIALGRPAQAILARLGEAGAAGARVDALARLAGTAQDRVRRWLHEVGAKPDGGDRVVAPAIWDTLRAQALAALACHHRVHPMEHGLPKAQLLAAMSASLGSGIGEAAIQDLAASGRIVHDRGLFRRTDFDPSRQSHEGTRRIEELFRRARLMPPDEAEAVAGDGARREALRYLLRQGVLVRTHDRVQGRSVIFHREAIGEAKRAIAEGLRHQEGFLAREAGALLGISRKFSIPLLEHLDAVRFTRRLGDRRTVLDGPIAAAQEAAAQEAAAQEAAQEAAPEQAAPEEAGPRTARSP